jgi:hypothetical protein
MSKCALVRLVTSGMKITRLTSGLSGNPAAKATRIPALHTQLYGWDCVLRSIRVSPLYHCFSHKLHSFDPARHISTMRTGMRSSAFCFSLTLNVLVQPSSTAATGRLPVSTTRLTAA